MVVLRWRCRNHIQDQNRSFTNPPMASSSRLWPLWPVLTPNRQSRSTLVPQALPEVNDLRRLTTVVTCALPKAQPDQALVLNQPQVPIHWLHQCNVPGHYLNQTWSNKRLDTLSSIGSNSGLMASTQQISGNTASGLFRNLPQPLYSRILQYGIIGVGLQKLYNAIHIVLKARCW